MTAKRKPKKKQFDLNRGLLAVILSIITTVLLIVALILESGLVWAATGLSALATVGAAKAAQKQAENQQKRRALPQRPPRLPPSVTPKPEPVETGEQAGEVVTCTKTGKVVFPRPEREQDRCPCPQRHVTSADGVRTFGLPLGSPIVPKFKAKRPRTSKVRA